VFEITINVLIYNFIAHGAGQGKSNSG